MDKITQHSANDAPEIAAWHIPEHALLRPIASGAYGEVWLARNAVGTLRAVKIVRRDRHASAESFEREFKGLQKFEPVSRAHEGLVDILTLGLLPEGAGFYYVMELADDRGGRASSRAVELGDQGSSGASPSLKDSTYAPRTLRADFKTRGALPADEVIALGLKLTAALAHLHGHELVHRDVKPSNIIFIDGEPKLADAGLVAAMDDARSLVGTAGYIAPEGPGTPQADLYALGKVLYEAAFGKDRQEFPALPVDIASRPDHAQLLELNATLLKASAANAEVRYQIAEEMCADLELLRVGKSVKQRQLWQARVRFGRRLATAAAIMPLLFFGFILARNKPLWRTTATINSAKELFEYSGTTNRDAFNEYLLGRYNRNKLASDGMSNAVRHFERAIALDPKFARAYAGLSDSLIINDYFDGLSPRETKERALAAARKALELASDLAEAHTAHGYVLHEYLWDREGAEREFKRALELDPNNAEAHHIYAVLLGDTGRLAESRVEDRKALDLDPLSPRTAVDWAGDFYWARDFEKAIEETKNALRIDPNYPEGYVYLRDVYESAGKYAEAMVAWERAFFLSGARPERIAELRRAFETGGMNGAWRMRLQWSKQQLETLPVAASDLAEQSFRAGELEEGLRWLREAIDRREARLGNFAGMPHYQEARRDPRFQALLREVNLVK